MRIIKLKSGKNFRDLGNLKLKNGNILPTGKYFRGKSLFKLKQKDLISLTEEYKVKTVIDLRTKKEILEKPNPKIEGVNFLNLPIFTEEKAGISRDKKSISLDTLKHSPEMVDVYRTMADDDCINNLQIVLETIISLDESELPVLFHCSAGKDRTGVISALLLKYFGAEDKDIYEDYLYTNNDGKFMHKFLCVLFAIVFFNVKLAKKLDRVFKADKLYLDAFFNELTKKFGSVEDFLKKVSHKK